MVDLYLQAMMNGLHTFKEDKFAAAIADEIKRYVDSLSLEDNQEGQLIDPKMRRAKLIAELQEEVKMPDLNEYIKSAFDFIRNNGVYYLDSAAYKKMGEEFRQGATLLDKLNLQEEITRNFQDRLGISGETMAAIYQIAAQTFIEEKYQDSLPLFVLLTALNPSHAEYWYRLGMAAQKSGKIDLALKSYALSCCLDSTLIGPRLFAAECYLSNGETADALAELTEAKKNDEYHDVNSTWHALIKLIESRLKVKLK